MLSTTFTLGAPFAVVVLYIIPDTNFTRCVRVLQVPSNRFRPRIGKTRLLLRRQRVLATIHAVFLNKTYRTGLDLRILLRHHSSLCSSLQDQSLQIDRH